MNIAKYDIIYLQVSDEETDEEYYDPDDTTWCQDRIGGQDIKYIRADLVEQQLAERDKQIVALHEHAKAIQGHMNLYRLFSCEGSDSYDLECAEKNLDKVNEHAKALDATADFAGCIICDAEPVAVADGSFNHNCELGTPLYKAKELGK
jgi:hypothetical protein